jgi:transcriptional regulator with XRE-family HTH domain
MPKTGDQKSADDSLGAHLMRLRDASGLTLRQVADATDKEVSNSHLSQLENGKILKPSPHVLDALAGVYKTSYEDLMKRAGYFSTSTDTTGKRRAKAATFTIQGLTTDEEKVLLEYLAFIRKQRRK